MSGDETTLTMVPAGRRRFLRSEKIRTFAALGTLSKVKDERSAHRIRQDRLNFIVVSADYQNECFWQLNISQPMENSTRSLETILTQRQWNPERHSAEQPSENECSFSAISKAWWTKRPAAHRLVISSQLGNPPMEDMVLCELDS